MCHQVSQVHLPPEKLEECYHCKKKSTTFDFCKSCAERAYCSRECQREDWPRHKSNYGRTDRIALEEFYPFLAWTFESANHMDMKPLHMATQYRIINSPNPDVFPLPLPDGWQAKLIMIDDTQRPTSFFDKMQWFPKASEPKVARKLHRRITYSGYVLPVVTSIAAAILVEMYTTTSGAESDERRLRFRYRSSPISDFGIVTGSADVKNQDRLAYSKKSDGTYFRGQDPDEHYCLYFATARGEEVILDCAMFTFNMCLTVDSTPYISSGLPNVATFGHVPAVFTERILRKNAPALHKERKRMSILRDPKLHEVVETYAEERNTSGSVSQTALGPFINYMETLSGRSLTEVEKDIFCRLVQRQCVSLHHVLCPENSHWKNFPKEPMVGMEDDPGQLDAINDPKGDSAKRREQWKQRNKHQRR